MSEYMLPDLAYDPGALEPYLSGQIVELHHDKHHADLCEGCQHRARQARRGPRVGQVRQRSSASRSRSPSTSVGTCCTRCTGPTCPPTAATSPSGDLAAAIDDQFGSFDAFKAHFTEATNTVQGSGWGIFSWEPVGRRLIIEQLEDHHENTTLGAVPLLAIDAWEHAYYLQYQNRRPDTSKQSGTSSTGPIVAPQPLSQQYR